MHNYYDDFVENDDMADEWSGWIPLSPIEFNGCDKILAPLPYGELTENGEVVKYKKPL